MFCSSDGGFSWRPALKLPLSYKSALQGLSPTLRRLFRQDVHHIVPINKDLVVAFAFRGVFLLDLRKGEVVSEPSPIIGSRPLSVCITPNGYLYYGQYVRNRDREPVHIFCSSDTGRSWNCVYRFDGIRHVHGVYYDPYEDSCWVTTGDTDSESAIWVSHDQFRTLKMVVGGSQQFRAVRLLFDPDYVYFGSDAPDDVNYISRISRNTLETERLAAVGGPIFHGCKTNSGLFFSTVCEPTRVGHEREAVVWHSYDGAMWSVLARFKKDLLPMKLFQYGQVFFADGTVSMPGVWVSPFATEYSEKSLYLGEDDISSAHSLLKRQ